MITAAALLLALLLVLLLTRGVGIGKLTALERAFLLCTPLPAIIAFVLPGSLSMLLGETATARRWINLLSESGIVLSAVLFLAGVWLIWARHLRGEPRDVRMSVGVLLAAVPSLLVLLVALLYLWPR